MVVTMGLLVLVSPLQLLFLIPGLSPNAYLWIQIACSTIPLPIVVFNSMAEGPLAMSLLPKDRYGQFCAANAMLRMVFGQIIGGFVAAGLMGVLEHYWGSYAWRFAFAWNVFFQALDFVCYYLLYRK